MVCGMTDEYEVLTVVRRAVLEAGVKHGLGAEEATDIVACVDELLRGELGTRCPYIPARDRRARNDAIAERARAGATVKEIAREFGLSESWTREILSLCGR